MPLVILLNKCAPHQYLVLIIIWKFTSKYLQSQFSTFPFPRFHSKGQHWELELLSNIHRKPKLYNSLPNYNPQQLPSIQRKIFPLTFHISTLRRKKRKHSSKIAANSWTLDASIGESIDRTWQFLTSSAKLVTSAENNVFHVRFSREARFWFGGNQRGRGERALAEPRWGALAMTWRTRRARDSTCCPDRRLLWLVPLSALPTIESSKARKLEDPASARARASRPDRALCLVCALRADGANERKLNLDFGLRWRVCFDKAAARPLFRKKMSVFGGGNGKEYKTVCAFFWVKEKR